MTEEEINTKSWEGVIIGFFDTKKNLEEVKYLKERIKIVNAEFTKTKYQDNQDLKDFFDTKKNKKTKEQTDIEFQRIKSLKILKLKKKPDNISNKELIKGYRDKLIKINNKYSPREWITSAAKNASSVSFATHVSKLTHSKIDTPSLFDNIDSKDFKYLTTSALQSKIIDGAVAGNQFAPIFQFLELELDGVKLVSQFEDINNEILKEFCNDSDNDIDIELSSWNKGFKNALSAKDKSSHSLAKQIYFPTIDKQYHLLCLLKSSSLAHAIFMSYPDNKQRKIQKELVSKGKFKDLITFSLLNKGKLSVTASNHSNASQLNGKRGGKIYLLSSQPPSWQTQLKPPIHKKSFFDKFYPKTIKEGIAYLTEYLLRNERIELSIKNPEKLAWIEKWVKHIIDEVFYYISTIQNLPKNWSSSKDVKLKDYHKYLLDPYNDDKQFQAQRKEKDWQKKVCKEFASWLNRLLKGKDKKFTPQRQYTQLWMKLFENLLREDAEEITWDIKNMENQS